MYRLFGLIALISLCFTAKSNAVLETDTLDQKAQWNSEESYEASHFLFLAADSVDRSEDFPKPKKRKLKAALLSVFLGHFGVHRIYLGTSANVPVAYSLTLGGGLGLLPFIDAIAIISSKDLEEFSNNNRVIMWSKPKGK